MLVLLLDPVEDDGARAEVDVFVADIRRAVAPGIPAAEWPAYQARIRAAVRHRDGGVAAPYRKFIVDQEISVLGVCYLFEAFGHQRLLDGGLHALAIHGIVGIGLLPRRWVAPIAPQIIPRNDRPAIARAARGGPFFHGRSPCPCGVIRDSNVVIANDADVFVAAGGENQ